MAVVQDHVKQNTVPQPGLLLQRRTIAMELYAKKKNTNIPKNTNQKRDLDDDDDDDDDDGEVGTGPNWIERSFPVDIGASDGESTSAKDLIKVEDYDLGISGVSFQTGQLSKRMFDTIMSKSQFAANPNEEIRRAFTLYAMDFTAKEATKAALKLNGLEMALMEEEEDEGMWGDLDSIRLLDETTQEPLPGKVYESTAEAIDVGGWKPGQGFDFVVRQVPSKMRELSLDELLQALDPDGSLREETREANLTLPDEDIQSLGALANDSMRRSENAPRQATTEDEAFAGIEGNRGYRPINLSDLLAQEEDGTEYHETTMHVMHALVGHGALIVDMTDGGTNFAIAKQLAKMWKGIQQFYDKVDQDESITKVLPPMTAIMETGSQTAKIGFASYDHDSLQFLETRRNRNTGELLPEEALSILGDDAVSALKDVFDAISGAGKSLVRIAVAASSIEAGAFSTESNPEVLASKSAALMADELLDDGSASMSSTEFPICMSPHRLCRYTNNQQESPHESKESNNDEKESAPPPSLSREVFGAHVDSTWSTIVPVAAVSGLEVLDETEEAWYRPELAARRHWQSQQTKRGEDPNSLFETVERDAAGLPWYCRYVVLMPGELLQLATRNEIPAAVHRVVATKNCPSRLSAPILLRCRPGVKMDASRYLGGTGGDPLLEECNGMTIEQIHDALQPTSFQ